LITTLHGDCRELLPTLPDRSVQCCVTSPPYYGLRDYGTAQWDGGDAACDHGAAYREKRQATRQAGVNGGIPGSERDPPQTVCKCGARRIDAQLGLEATPDAYVAALVGVFREVRRVLRDDGTLWLNLGDSYFSPTATQGRNERKSQITTLTRHGANGRSGALDEQKPTTFQRNGSGLKPKDLLMMPARVALALQADGWWLRSAIVWHKPNPMPESVRDRPTSAYEMVYLLTKSDRYYYDADAVREAACGAAELPRRHGNGETVQGPGGGYRLGSTTGRRNCRNVWTITPKPYKGAHFATFPPELAARCIKAGSKPGDTILDPFSGAGTTALVADQLGRDGLQIELNVAYIALAEQRTAPPPAKPARAPKPVRSPRPPQPMPLFEWATA